MGTAHFRLYEKMFLWCKSTVNDICGEDRTEELSVDALQVLEKLLGRVPINFFPPTESNPRFRASLGATTYNGCKTMEGLEVSGLSFALLLNAFNPPECPSPADPEATMRQLREQLLADRASKAANEPWGTGNILLSMADPSEDPLYSQQEQQAGSSGEGVGGDVGGDAGGDAGGVAGGVAVGAIEAGWSDDEAANEKLAVDVDAAASSLSLGSLALPSHRSTSSSLPPLQSTTSNPHPELYPLSAMGSMQSVRISVRLYEKMFLWSKRTINDIYGQESTVELKVETLQAIERLLDVAGGGPVNIFPPDSDFATQDRPLAPAATTGKTAALQMSLESFDLLWPAFPFLDEDRSKADQDAAMDKLRDQLLADRRAAGDSRAFGMVLLTMTDPYDDDRYWEQNREQNQETGASGQEAEEDAGGAQRVGGDAGDDAGGVTGGVMGGGLLGALEEGWSVDKAAYEKLNEDLVACLQRAVKMGEEKVEVWQARVERFKSLLAVQKTRESTSQSYQDNV